MASHSCRSRGPPGHIGGSVSTLEKLIDSLEAYSFDVPATSMDQIDDLALITFALDGEPLGDTCPRCEKVPLYIASLCCDACAAITMYRTDIVAQGVFHIGISGRRGPRAKEAGTSLKRLLNNRYLHSLRRGELHRLRPRLLLLLRLGIQPVLFQPLKVALPRVRRLFHQAPSRLLTDQVR